MKRIYGLRQPHFYDLRQPHFYSLRQLHYNFTNDDATPGVFITAKPMRRNRVIKQAIPIDGVEDRVNRVPAHQMCLAWYQYAGLFCTFEVFCHRFGATPK